jgi:hypothetical protein
VLRLQVVSLVAAAGAALVVARRCDTARSAMFLRVAAIVLALGALRAGIWAAGGPVFIANLVVLVVGAVLAAAAVARSRRRRQQGQL